MKKEDFMKIMRSKASKPLTADEEAFLTPIGIAIEDAFGLDAIERNAKIEGILTLKNSSRLEEKIDKKEIRLYSGTVLSAASISTR